MRKVKGKVIPVPNYAKRHEDVWGRRGIAPQIITSLQDGSEWSASIPCHFTPGEPAPVLIGLSAAWAPKPG
jgi:hypothetical protein